MDNRDYQRIDSKIRNKYYRVEQRGHNTWIVPQDSYLESLGEDVDVEAALEHISLVLGDDLHTEGPHGPYAATPGPWKVCPTCDGNGKHVSPNIDRGGISREDFDSDPDFEESYFSGMYDVTCSQCNGLRVVRDVEPASYAGEVFMARVASMIEDAWEYERECAAERRYMYGREYEW